MTPAKRVIRLHPHCRQRMHERGVTEEEVAATITGGERFPAKHGRLGFRRNFRFGGIWRGTRYETKQVEVFAVKENDCLLVLTVIARYF